MAGEPRPVGAGLAVHEHTGCQPIPVQVPVGWRMWYSVYLGNWDQFTTADRSIFEALKSQPSPEQLAIQETWATMGVTRSEAKAIEAKACGDCLGVAITLAAVLYWVFCRAYCPGHT